MPRNGTTVQMMRPFRCFWYLYRVCSRGVSVPDRAMAQLRTTVNHLPGQLPAPFCSPTASLHLIAPHLTSTQPIIGEPRTRNPLVHHPLALLTASEVSCRALFAFLSFNTGQTEAATPFRLVTFVSQTSERQSLTIKNFKMILFCLVFTVLLTLGAAFADPSRPLARRDGFSVPVAQAHGSKRDFVRDWVAAHQKWGAGAPAGIASAFSLADDGRLTTSCPPAQRVRS